MCVEKKMRNFLLLILFISIISKATTRPSRFDQRNVNLDQVDEREAEEVEYGNNEENPGENSFQEEEEPNLNDQEPRDGETVQDDEVRGDEAAKEQRQNKLNEEKYMSRVVVEEQPDKPSNDRLMDYSQRNKEEKMNEESPNNEMLPKRRQSNRYIEGNEPADGPENTQHPANKLNRMQNDVRDNEIDKRTIDARRIPSDESESLFDNQRLHRNNPDRIEYHNENTDSSEQNHRLKQYYNVMQSDHKSMLRESNYDVPQFMANRDRRQAEPTDVLGMTSSSTEKDSFMSDSVNEDDEAAIKRHIKKLSGEELEELLNSLSDEKKALLNKIMDSNHNYDSINKREITKKAEAMEQENNYMDIGVSEINKLQAVSSSIDGSTESAIVQSSDTPETKQEGQTEGSDMADAKMPETTKAEVSDNRAEVVDAVAVANNDVNLNAKEETNNSQLTKSESKREVNTDYFQNQDEMLDDSQLSDNYLNIRDAEEPLNEQGHSCVSQDEDMSQLIDDEAQLHQNQEFKREAVEDEQMELDNSMKSLEESFPKSDREESGQYFESNMAPLIRVKRKDNHEIQKRADDKVAFVPYKAENDDEDNDEGSEFDDDGFFDRTANFAKSNVNKIDDNSVPNNFGFGHLVKKPKQCASNKDMAKLSESSPENKLNGESRSLGSDTDSVLSGVEGVDDNLMYNSGIRNRRTLQENVMQTMNSNRSLRSTPFIDENAKPLDNHINIPHYQENDAFGALPRSYEGDLGRYKRIRRVKPSSDISESKE